MPECVHACYDGNGDTHAETDRANLTNGQLAGRNSGMDRVC
jgi:hypothetical protein